MGHMSFVFPNGVIQAPLPHTMVLPPKKLPASTTSRRTSPKPKRLQKTELGELRSTPTKPQNPKTPLSPPSTSVLTTSTILILLALLFTLYVQYACPAADPVCARVSAAQEWAAPHLAWSAPYLEKIRGYTESIDELGAPYLARSQGILREVWERNVQPHVRTIWEKVQGEVGKRR